MALTDVAPEPAVKSLLALSVTGDPQARIVAARELTASFGTDPTVRDTPRR